MTFIFKHSPQTLHIQFQPVGDEKRTQFPLFILINEIMYSVCALTLVLELTYMNSQLMLPSSGPMSLCFSLKPK